MAENLEDFEFNRAEGEQSDYTAQAVNGEADNQSNLEVQRAAQAAAAGVRDARFIGYAEVLSNYANRSDVETLQDRRARHLGTDPGQQSFTRDAKYDAGAGTSTDPQTSFPESGNWTEDESDDTVAGPGES